MTWFLTAIGVILGLLALEVVLELTFEALWPLRRVFEPPAGGLCLAATWVLAVASTLAGWHLGPTHPALGPAMFSLSVPMALISTLVYRDVSREVHSVSPPHAPGAPKLTRVGRYGCGLASTALLGTALTGFIRPQIGIPEIVLLGAALFGAWLLFVCVTGHAPRTMRDVLNLRDL